MTYEELYKPAIAEYMQKWESYFAQFKVREYKGMNIIQMREELDSRKAQLAKLEAAKPDNFDFNLAAALDQKFQKPIEAYAQAVAALDGKYEESKQRLNQEHDAAVAAADAEAENSVSDLTKKYDTLLTYKDKVADAVLRYGIKPSTLNIDEDALTRKDMEALIDTALSACRFLGEDKMRARLKKWYAPPEDGGPDSRQNTAICILAAVFFLSPIFLGAMFFYMYWHTARIYMNIEGLRIADKLMYGVNFAKFRDAPKYADIPDVDYAELEAAKSAELEKLAAGDPSKVREAMQQEINRNHSKIAEDFRAATNHVMGKYDSLLRIYRDSVAALQKIVDDYIANMKTFGSVCNTGYVMDTQFTLGKQKGTLDVKYDIGLKNIVFANRSREMLLFIKLMLANAMLSVRPRQFSCTIYDPEGLGADFATFLSQETVNYIEIATGTLDKHLESLRQDSLKNLRALDQQDVNTFNKEAEGSGRVTIEYKLLIIVSGVDKLEENKILTEFMQFSARTGVMVWVVNPNPLPGCTFYSKPFDGVDEPYDTSPALFNTVMSTYINALANLKEAGIQYFPSFGDKFLPKEKWWTENCDKGIKLNFGLQDGDPSKGFDILLGDSPVHGLCVGATGAGKSAFLNQLLASLCTRYSPADLSLIMVDFKNIEFVSLSDPKTHMSRVPHASILSGTKDGEYAVSIFEYAIAEMTRRNNVVFSDAGVKKLEDYNKKMRTLNMVDKCLPRVLMIIDEFQVMFTIDDKIVNKIKILIQRLAKEARSAGIHMLFTSQSMAGTLSKDIKDQFGLRVALRCSSDTSTEILGSDVASKIKAQFGYLYSNTAAGETQDSTTMWRTPFLADKYWFSTEKMEAAIAKGEEPPGSLCILDQLSKMCEERHIVNRKAFFYSSSQQWPASHLQSWLSMHNDIVAKNPGLIILGERTSFSSNNAPVNFRISRTDGENILMYAFNNEDLCDLIRTLVTDLKADKNNTILMNSADPDYYDILDIPSIVGEDYAEIARPTMDPDEWLEFLEGIIEERREEGVEGKSPLYFFAIRWDKQFGIYRGDNYRTQERFKAILQDGPAVDVHIILCAALFKEIEPRHLVLFNHKICGKGPADAGYKFLDSGVNASLPDHPVKETDDSAVAIYLYGQDMTKFKIYRFEYEKAFESRELVL